METRKPLDGQAAGIMLVLCMIWGLQQVALKAGATDVAPLLQIALRSGVAAVLVALLMRARGERLYVADGSWRPGLLAGLLFAFEFLLAGEALRHTSAAHTAVFLYTAPIFAALGLLSGFWLPSMRATVSEERMRRADQVASSSAECERLLMAEMATIDAENEPAAIEHKEQI